MSAAEGQKFARVMAEIEEMRAKVTPKEIKHTRKVLEKQESEKKRVPAATGSST